MVEKTLTIRLTANGKQLIGTLKLTKKELKSLNTQTKSAHNHADKMKDSMGAMNNIMYAFVAIGVATKMVGITDAMKQLNSRLELATGSSEEFGRAQQDVFNIAQTTGIKLTSVGDLYTKFARATKNLNVSQADLALITSTVSKAIVVSGASAQEADAALLQLSQGMASGVLRGQELNSVMEQTPRLSRAIAEGMGVELGQLRALGVQGKITTKIVVDALKSQSDAISGEFDVMVKTVSRSWTELGNSLALYLSKSNVVNRITTNLTRSFSQLATVIGDVAEGIIGEQGLMEAIGQADMDAATASTERHRQKIEELNITLDRLKTAQEEGGVSQAKSISIVTEQLRKQNIMLQAVQESYIAAAAASDGFFRERIRAGKQFERNEGRLKLLRSQIRIIEGTKTTNPTVLAFVADYRKEISSLTKEQKKLAGQIDSVNKIETALNVTRKEALSATREANKVAKVSAASTIDLAIAKKGLAAAIKEEDREWAAFAKSLKAETDAELKAKLATISYTKSMENQIRILKVRKTQGKTAARVEADWIRAQDEGLNVSREYIASQYEQITAMEGFENQGKKSIGEVDRITQNFYRNAQRGLGDLIYKNVKTGFKDWSSIAKDAFNTIRDGLYRLVSDMISRWAMLKVAGVFGFGDGGGGYFSGGYGGGSSGGFGGQVVNAGMGKAISSYFGGGSGAAGVGGSAAAGATGEIIGSVGGAYAYSALGGAADSWLGANVAYGANDVAAGIKGLTWAKEAKGAIETAKAIKTAKVAVDGYTTAQTVATEGSQVAGGAMAAWGAVAVAAYIAIGGAIDAARIDKENAKMTKEFNRLRTETDAFAGEGVKVSDTLSIIGDEMGALYVRATENENGLFPDISTFYDQLGEVGAQLRYIYDDTGEAIAMITGNIVDAQSIIEKGFDNAKLSFTEFQGATQGGLTSMDATFRGSAAEWTRVLQNAMNSGTVSSQASFQVIEDDAGNTFLRMQGQANEWANYLASQGRIASESFASSMNYMFAEGDNMFGNLTSQARSFQSIINGIKGPNLSGNLSLSSGGGGISGFADGGISHGPQLAYVSEGRYSAEAHVPLPNGRSIPVNINGGNNKDVVAAINKLGERLGAVERAVQAGAGQVEEAVASVKGAVDKNTEERPSDLRTSSRTLSLARVGVSI